MRVVDGGYFENSGATSIMDLLDALADQDGTMLPVLVLIRNDPLAPPLCSRGGPTQARLEPWGPEGPRAAEFLNEVSSPIRTLLNTRYFVTQLAETAAIRKVEDELGGVVIEISLADLVDIAPDVSQFGDQDVKTAIQRILPPLGWWLSGATRQAMDQVLDGRRGKLGRGFEILASVLKDTSLLSGQRCMGR